tara:strand:- start:233 stop:712 length:480 start_codon:yes stop_codon:yes gene_type:complete
MIIKYNTKQRYKVIQGLRSFKDTLPKEAKRILVKKGEIYNKTLDNWKYFVGENLFKVCYPKSFKGSNKIRGSSIDIMVRRGNEVDLEYEKKNIISKINAYFGYQVVKVIKIITFEGKLEKNKVKKAINATKKNQIKKINNIKNIKIKSSLLELSKLYRK